MLVVETTTYAKSFSLLTKILFLREFHHIVTWMVCVFDSYVALSLTVGQNQLNFWQNKILEVNRLYFFEST